MLMEGNIFWNMVAINLVSLSSVVRLFNISWERQYALNYKLNNF